MALQIPLSISARGFDAERDAARGDLTREIAADLAYRRLAIVNVVFFGPQLAGDRGWVLIDAGLAGTAGLTAERRPSASAKARGRW